MPYHDHLGREIEDLEGDNMRQDQLEAGRVKVFQVYYFQGENIGAVYDQANQFLASLADLGIEVEVKPEDIRPDTKNYHSYDTSVTTINIVALVMKRAIEAVKAIHREIITPPEPESKSSQESAASDDFDPFIDLDELP